MHAFNLRSDHREECEVMASDGSADEAVFTDCAASGAELSDTPGPRRRRVSVTEMVRRAETRQKRPAPDRGSKSPCDRVLPAAKRPLGEPAESTGVELSAGALAAIRQTVDAGIASMIGAFEAKFEKMEKRLSLLESEMMDKDIKLRDLGEKLTRQMEDNAELRTQIENMDLNRRLSSLILTCDDFGPRLTGEDIEEKVVSVLSERIPGLKLALSDIHVAHRLQRDDKVIVKFLKRSLRDKIYDSRFNLASFSPGQSLVQSGAGGAPNIRGDRRLASLYITESLTAYNQRLYNQLLQARKSSGGERVASVFSRRGLVYCRTVKNGPNIRVPDEVTLRRVIGSAGPGQSLPVSAAVAPPGRGGRRAGAPVSAGGVGGGLPRSAGAPAAAAPPAPPAPVALEAAFYDRRSTVAVPSAAAGGANPSGGTVAPGRPPTARTPVSAVGAPPVDAVGVPGVAAAAESSPGAVTAVPPSAAAVEASAVAAAESSAASELTAVVEVAPPVESPGAPSVVVSAPPGGAVR